MQEDIIFKRRNKLRKHFVNTSNVLLYCYKQLSDAARTTYQVIDSFDWEEKETGESKGYVFPAVETLADIRGTTTRTVQRHIRELEHVGLLTRQRRSHQASYLFIEDVSEEEAQVYLEKYVHKQRKEQEPQKSNDKNVVSLTGSQTTKMSIDNNKEKEKKENEINVNGNFKKTDEKKRYGMQGMKDIMQRFDILQPLPVQKPKLPRKSSARQPSEEKLKRDYFAEQIATELDDQKSLGCYRVIAERVPQAVIFETLGSVKEMWRGGNIKKSRGALFVDIIKQRCEKKQIALPFGERDLPKSSQLKSPPTKKETGVSSRKEIGTPVNGIKADMLALMPQVGTLSRSLVFEPAFYYSGKKSIAKEMSINQQGQKCNESNKRNL